MKDLLDALVTVGRAAVCWPHHPKHVGRGVPYHLATVALEVEVRIVPKEFKTEMQDHMYIKLQFCLLNDGNFLTTNHERQPINNCTFPLIIIFHSKFILSLFDLRT